MNESDPFLAGVIHGMEKAAESETDAAMVARGLIQSSRARALALSPVIGAIYAGKGRRMAGAAGGTAGGLLGYEVGGGVGQSIGKKYKLERSGRAVGGETGSALMARGVGRWIRETGEGMDKQAIGIGVVSPVASAASKAVQNIASKIKPPSPPKIDPARVAPLENRRRPFVAPKAATPKTPAVPTLQTPRKPEIMTPKPTPHPATGMRSQ